VLDIFKVPETGTLALSLLDAAADPSPPATRRSSLPNGGLVLPFLHSCAEKHERLFY